MMLEASGSFLLVLILSSSKKVADALLTYRGAEK